MKITVFGSGYVGLVQSAVLAEAGHQVCCIDIDEERIARLTAGNIPIHEPGLAPLVAENLREERLFFSTDAATAVAHGEFQFVAVGTPPDEDGSADLRHVLAVAETIAGYMEQPRIIVNKSTVPVGTAERVRQQVARVLRERGAEIAFEVVSNPEFLKEGAAVADCTKPDRIIVGTDNPEVVDKFRELYAPFNRNHDRMIFMDPRSAELTKYAANCMLATKISFMNEMANLAERLGADIEAVRQGIGSDRRIGFHFIYPGCGYGGSCFPKDVQALIHTAKGDGYAPAVLQAVEEVNQRQKELLHKKISHHYQADLQGRTFALWGLSFKPNTDDMRQAPSRVLMEALWQAGARIQAYDPEAMEECQRLYGHRAELTLTGTKEAALRGADALVIVTEWQPFRAPDFELIKSELAEPVIFDGRNLFEPSRMRDKDFIYYSIGRS
ncbi:MAG: UDP-glucose/GDP-mannose dehydrogenase family protein [Desulfurivibrio sp.]|nr:UDP-glucose/GDP-mannose dehydrogenase family protein [Desulfurivibrio sp.]